MADKDGTPQPCGTRAAVLKLDAHCKDRRHDQSKEQTGGLGLVQRLNGVGRVEKLVHRPRDEVAEQQWRRRE